MIFNNRLETQKVGEESREQRAESREQIAKSRREEERAADRRGVVGVEPPEGLIQ
jgi:hypothetical protein